MILACQNIEKSFDGELLLQDVNFHIEEREKAALIGINGTGKTTLLRIIMGELPADNGQVILSRGKTIGYLAQHQEIDTNLSIYGSLLEMKQHILDIEQNMRALEKEMKHASGEELSKIMESYSRLTQKFEQENGYACKSEIIGVLKGLGFEEKDFDKMVSTLSGGQKTRVALGRLLLSSPDIILLDEPTNHLDMETAGWLEQYMKHYKNAVLMVSHDRFFLDQTADVVYELTGKGLRRYPGNYTHYREEKLKQIRLQKKAYERQQEELARLENLVERFKHKPNKAAFARAKRKTMEHMERVEKPQEDDAHIFTGEINPLLPGSKWVFTSEHLKIGYEKPLLEITMRIRRGQKIALLGPNGAGKTTFLKTIAGFLPSLEGSYSLGNQTTIGYFDQHSGAIQSEQTVLEHFTAQFPALTEKEARSILGAYLFGGRDAQKKVSSLSGGEKARLVLAELLQSRPNFLVLDEPTNHMDIQAKETLESAFRAYKGTILFVSHDRYLIRQVADAVMIFENQTVMYYPFGYEHYLERKARENQGGSMAAQIRAEEQALIAGMRAVPKAERHRLREIPEDEAYREWNMGLAAQHLEPAGNAVEYLTEQVRELRAMWHGSEEYWNGGAWERMNEYEDRCLRLEQAWEEWHRACMEWLEKAQEMEVL